MFFCCCCCCLFVLFLWGGVRQREGLICFKCSLEMSNAQLGLTENYQYRGKELLS